MIFLLAFVDEEERKKFEYIYAKYKHLLFYKAFEILRDHMLAEDAVSEACLRVYRNMHKIDDPDSPRAAAFVVTIVRNAAISMYTRGGRAEAEELDEALPDTFDLEGAVVSAMSSERVYALVGDMDEELRNIFVLKFAYDMSHGEIAASLGLTENSVSVKLHRAKKRLAQKLREEGYADETHR